MHDLGRVAVSTSVWNKPGALSADEWERVRLHAHHSERVIARSSTLEPVAAVAGAHHERLDGSGYHRGSSGPVLSMPVRVLAAADAYRTLVEPRPHRGGHSSADAARLLGDSVDAGELDADAVAAVLQAAGQAVPRMRRPAGLTDREATVVGLVARGLQTKQVAHRLGISPKTADRHLQNAYAKMGVSTRAAATLFAMEHGLVPWGELRCRRRAHAPSVDLRGPAECGSPVEEVIMRRFLMGTAWAGIAGPVLFTVSFLAQQALRQ